MIRSKKTFHIIYALAFLVSLSYALPLYIQSSFLGSFTSVRYVGVYITISIIVLLIVTVLFARFIKKYTNYRVMLVLAVLYTINIFFLINARSSLTVFIFFTVYYVTIALLGINLDVFLEDISKRERIGKIRTIFLTIVNTAILLGPLLMGKIVGENEYYALPFLISAGIMGIVCMLLIIVRKNLNDHIGYKDRKFFNLLHILRKNKNIALVFLLSLILQFFFAIMVLYTPIYLHETFHFSWGKIGIIFTFMLAPFVLLELPAGKLSDTPFGEKELIIFGIAIMAIFTGAIFFLNTPSAIIWAIILFCTRVGAALLESMHEVYFFKIVKREDVDIIYLFRDAKPAGWLLGTVIAVILLQFFSLPYLFLYLTFFLLLSLIPAFALEDTK